MPRIRFTRKGCLLKVLVLAGVVVVIGATVLYVMRSRSVLYRYVDSGDPAGEPGFSIFNPFRDRLPEKCAESFLGRMRAGKCEDAMSSLSVEDEYRQHICEMEREYPLASWHLKNRIDERDRVRMFYWHLSQDSKAYGRLWVTVEKRDERWHVIGYERHY